MNQSPDQSTDQFAESGHGIARTDVRTNGDKMVTRESNLSESNARANGKNVVRPIQDGCVVALRKFAEHYRDSRDELDRAIAYARHVGLSEDEIRAAVGQGAPAPRPAASTPTARADALAATRAAVAAARTRRTSKDGETP